ASAPHLLPHDHAPGGQPSGRLCFFLISRSRGPSMSIRAVFLDHASLDLGDLDLAPLRDCFDELTLHDASETAQVSERLQGATVAITNKVRLDAEVFANCPELKLVLISATGTNNVDLRSEERRVGKEWGARR